MLAALRVLNSADNISGESKTMNGSEPQHRDEPQDDDLGLDLVSHVASSSPGERKTRPKRWIFIVVGIVVIAVVAAVLISLLTGGPKASKASKASDAQSVNVQLKSGGQATLSTSESKDAIGVELASLPPLDESEKYVAWAVHESGSVSVITTSSGEDESAGFSPAEDVIAIHITEENSKIPAAPSEDTEASVDVPFTKKADAQNTEGS